MLLAVCGESQQQTVPTPDSFIYRYSNYGIYAKLRDDRLTTWHLSFLELGDTLENVPVDTAGFASNTVVRKKRVVDARTGEDECGQNPPADHDLIAMRGRDSLLSVQSGVRYRRTKNCPRLLNIKNTTIANKEATTTLPIINNDKLIIGG